MADTKIRIVVDADADTAVREINRVDRAVAGMDSSADKAGKSHARLSGVMRAGAAGFAGLAVGAAAFGTSAVRAFTDAEAAQRRAETMLDKNNAGWRRHQGEIERTIQAHSRLGAFDDEDLMVSFANLSRASGDTNRALRDQQLAMDLARAKGISLEQATKVIERAYTGNTSALRRYGVEVEKGATTQEALAAAQRQFAGQAEAYGRTTAGQADNIRIAWGNFQEQVGSALVPAVNALLAAFNRAMPVIQEHAERVADWIREHWPQISEAFREVGRGLLRLWDAVEPIFELLLDAAREVVEWIDDHWDTISTVIGVVFRIVEVHIRTLVTVLRTAFETAATIIRGLVTAIQAIAGPVATAARAIWTAVTTAVTAPLDFLGWLNRNILQPITGFLSSAADRGRAIATNIWAGVTGFATDMAGWIQNRIITPITSALQGIQARGEAVARNIWAGVTSFVTDMVGWIRNRIIEPITDRLPAVLSKGKDVAEAVWQGFRAVLIDMVGWIRDRIIEPITERLAAIIAKGRDIAESIANGMRQGAVAVKDAVVGAFKGFLNAIIRVINFLPFVNIPMLAEGGVIRGPQLAVVGEDGPEAVIPLGAKRRKRGVDLLRQAAGIMGVRGDPPELRMMADGGIVLSRAYSSGVTEGAAAGNPNRVGGFTDGVLAGMAKIAEAGVGAILGRLPSAPSVAGAGGVNRLFGGVREAAASYLRGIFSQKDQWGNGRIMQAKLWAAEAVRTGSYLWGGGHGGWDFRLPKGYDCSGFASHAAKMAGSSLGGPGTTMSLLPASRQVAGTSGYPVLFGFRGMDQGNPRSQHMGIRILRDWYSFGPAFGDSRWTHYGIPPGLPGYQAGVDYVPRTGPAVIHAGEAVLNRRDAADYRAAQLGGVTVEIHGDQAADWLARFIEVRVDGMAQAANRRARAGIVR